PSLPANQSTRGGDRAAVPESRRTGRAPATALSRPGILARPAPALLVALFASRTLLVPTSRLRTEARHSGRGAARAGPREARAPRADPPRRTDGPTAFPPIRPAALRRRLAAARRSVILLTPDGVNAAPPALAPCGAAGDTRRS